MTAVAKYLFDVDFSAAELAGTGGEKITMNEHEQLVEIAREQAMEIGRQQGLEQARADQVAVAEQSLSGMIPALSAALQSLATWKTAIEQDCAAVALAAAKTISADLRDIDPHGALVSVVRTVVGEYRGDLRLQICAPATELEPLEARLQAEPQLAEIIDQVSYFADETMEAGDWHIRWGEGGLRHSSANVEAEISAAVMAHFGQKNSQNKSENTGLALVSAELNTDDDNHRKLVNEQ
jgi:flagellar biosynthesis/type III secretory pathway protein FliH